MTRGLALGLLMGLLAGVWLMATFRPVPAPPAPRRASPAPVVVMAPPPAAVDLTASPPTSLPPQSPLPPLPGLQAPSLAVSTSPPAPAPSIRPPRHASRILDQARRVSGVRSIAWGDGAQLYVMVEGARAKSVAFAICRKVGSQANSLRVIAQETQATAGHFITVERSCS